MDTKPRDTLMAGAATMALVAALAACQGSSGDGSTLSSVSQPAASAAGSATTLGRADSDMRSVLLSLQSLGPQPIETLSPAQARQQPTLGDAVEA